MNNPKINVHIYPSNMLFESRIFKIVDEINKLNYFSHIYLLGINDGNLPQQEFIRKTISIYRLNFQTKKWLKTGLLNKIVNVINISLKTFDFLKKRKPAVIHAHNLSSLPITVFYKLIYNCKVVYDTHELETEREGWPFLTRKISKFIESVLIKKVDVVVVVNEWIKKIYDTDYKINSYSILNIPKKFSAKKNDYLRKRFNISESKKIFVYLGAFTDSRGILEYIDFSKRTCLDICFIFIGNGPLKKEMELASKNTNNVFIHNSVPANKLKNIIGSADYSLQTLCFKNNLSKSYKLGLPNKLFESAMAGLPMIGGGFPVQSDFIKKNNIGEIIQNQDFDNFNSTFEKLIKADIGEYKRNLRKLILKYSWEKESKKIFEYYKTKII